MSSRKLTRSIIVGAAAIAVAGGSYGIVSATSSSSPAAASTSTSTAGGSRIRRRRIQRPVRAGRRGIIRHGQQPVHVGLHADDISGPEGDRQGGVLHDLREGDEPGLGECHHHRRKRPGPGDDQQHEHHRHPGHRRTGRQPLYGVLGRGGPLPARRSQHVQDSRPDPGRLQPGIGTIVSGTTANKATEAALAAYPRRGRRPASCS